MVLAFFRRTRDSKNKKFFGGRKMINAAELRKKLQQEELPFWGNWMGDYNYPSIKAAREAGLEASVALIKYKWECIFELPTDLKPLGVYEYEKANFPAGEYMKDDEDEEIYNAIFDGKKELSIEYLIERALRFAEPFKMLLEVVSLYEDDGYFDD